MDLCPTWSLTFDWGRCSKWKGLGLRWMDSLYNRMKPAVASHSASFAAFSYLAEMLLLFGIIYLIKTSVAGGYPKSQTSFIPLQGKFLGVIPSQRMVDR